MSGAARCNASAPQWYSSSYFATLHSTAAQVFKPSFLSISRSTGRLRQSHPKVGASLRDAAGHDVPHCAGEGVSLFFQSFSTSSAPAGTLVVASACPLRPTRKNSVPSLAGRWPRLLRRSRPGPKLPPSKTRSSGLEELERPTSWRLKGRLHRRHVECLLQSEPGFGSHPEHRSKRLQLRGPPGWW